MGYHVTYPVFDVSDLKKEVFKTSPLINVIGKYKKQLVKKSDYRTLTKSEIKALEERSCFSEDWKRVKVKKQGFSANRFVNSYFTGDVYLGTYTKDIEFKGVTLSSGIYHATLNNVIVGDDVLIKNAGLISNYVIENEATIINVDNLTCRPKSIFGNGTELPIAIETGGREVSVYAEITIKIVGTVSTHRFRKLFVKKYDNFIKEYCNAIEFDYGIIMDHAQISNSPLIDSVFIGPYTKIDNVILIRNTTILSNDEEVTKVTDGAYVIDSIMQWGCEVTSMGIVSKSVMVEHCHVERHGKLTESILGPNSMVAEGECTASLCGPYVGFHHQSLLIAAYWPEGKGNIGYGANVGSNHTGKAPDQEIWPGEGIFFGLGCNIKFPCNLVKAPYSIIASGVGTLPQKMEYPFSLINKPGKTFMDISPAYNEIIPGWVLSKNIYSIRRNEGKFVKRNKGRREYFKVEVFRPHIVDKIIQARNALLGVKTIKEVYTDRDLPGLGKNYLQEKNRLAAIEVYNFYLQFYALKGLYKKLKEYVSKGYKKEVFTKIYQEETTDQRWEHEKYVFLSELEEMDLWEAIYKYKEICKQIAKAVQRCKESDDIRGRKIIPDYETAHTVAEKDGFVVETWALYNEIIAELDDIIEKIY